MLPQKRYWCGRSGKADTVYDSAQSDEENFEKDPAHLTPGIQIFNLTKVSLRFRPPLLLPAHLHIPNIQIFNLNKINHRFKIWASYCLRLCSYVSNRNSVPTGHLTSLISNSMMTYTECHKMTTGHLSPVIL